MVSSQFVLLLAGAALSVNAQGSSEAKATLYNFAGLPLDEKATATQVGSNSAATTYVFACPTGAIGSAASSIGSAALSVGGAASSALGSAGSLVSSAANAGASAGSSVANDIKSQLSNVNLTPIPKPTNAARDLRLLPIPRPSKAARDLRLTPIAKPTQHARRQLPDLSIPCIPYTVVQGPEIYGVKAEVTAPVKFFGEFNATWKGDIKSADKVTGTFTMGGDVTMLSRSAVETAAPSEVFQSSIVVPVVSASATSSGGASKPSGSGSPSGTNAPAKNSNPAAAGPLPTGAAVYFGAAAGIFGAVLAL